MTLKAVWIVCLVLGGLVVVTSFWISAFFLRLDGNRGGRSSWLAISTTTLIVAYGVAIGYSALYRPPSSLGLLGAAIALLLLSLVFLWGAVLAHGKSRPAFAFVATAPETFVRAGPYRLVRHPLYAAYLFALVAGTLMAHGLWPHNLWLLVSIPWLGSFYYAAAKAEERAFCDTPFADQYAAYRATTGMFLPKPGAIFSCCTCRSRAGPEPERSGENGD